MHHGQHPGAPSHPGMLQIGENVLCLSTPNMGLFHPPPLTQPGPGAFLMALRTLEERFSLLL